MGEPRETPHCVHGHAPVRPLPFVWPYWLIFWAVFIWAFWPELQIVQRSRKAAAVPGSQDKGSLRLILLGGSVSTFAAFPLAWVRATRVALALHRPVFFLGVGLLFAGSLLRRHCFRMLGSSFTGNV